MNSGNTLKSIFLFLIFSLFSSCFANNHDHSHDHDKKDGNKRTFTIVNYQYESSRQWLPGTIAVYKGETVEIKLVNEAPSGVHGFAIPEYDIKEEVLKDKPVTVSFAANKVGIFDMKCHIHPAHVGGQIIVMEKPTN